MNFFITKNFDKKIETKSNIILSPEFYWIKRVSLNVRFTSEVKKMAPSLFDGLLPDGNFKYEVFKKSSNDYILVAFDIDSIKKELEKIGIDLSLIKRVYLAQSEFDIDGISLKMDNNFGISLLDGVVVYTPLELMQDSVEIDEVLKEKKLSSSYIHSFISGGVEVKNRWLNFAILVTLLLNALFLLNIYKIKKDINLILDTKSSIISKNHLPSTSFEIKSILKELLSKQNEIQQMKKSIDYLSKIPFKKDESLVYLNYSKNRLILKANSKAANEKLKKYLSKIPDLSIKTEVKK